MDTSLILSKSLLVWLLVIWLKVKITDGSEINETCVAEKRGMLIENLKKFYVGDEVLISGHFHDSGSIGTIWMSGSGENIWEKTLLLDEDNIVENVVESFYIPTEIKREGLTVKEENAALHVEVSNSTTSCSYQVKLPGSVAKSPMVTFTTDPQNERLLFIIETERKERQIYILHFDSQRLKRIELDETKTHCYAHWNPQGTGIIIVASENESTCERYPEVDNYLIHFDLETDYHVFSTKGHRIEAPTFSPDGGILAFLSHHTKDNESMPVSRNVLQTVHLVNLTTHQPIKHIQMFEEKEILFSDESSIFFLELEEGIVPFVTQGLLQSSERVLDVKDNKILTVKKEGFLTNILLGHIVNNELTTTTSQPTTTEEAMTSTTEMEPTTTETTTTTTQSTSTSKIPSICQDLFRSLLSEEEETESEALTTVLPEEDEEATTEYTTTEYPESIIFPTTTEIAEEIPKYTIHYQNLHFLNFDFFPFKQSMAVDRHDGHTHVIYKNMMHKKLLVLFPDIRNQHYYQERTLALGSKIHHDLLIIDYDLSDGLEGAVERAEDIINEIKHSYESIVFYGEGLGATIVSLITIHINNSKVVFSDPELNLLSLISDDHTVLSWVLGSPSPFIPTSEEIVYLWDMSPLSNVHNMTSEQLILITPSHHKEAKVYYEHLHEHLPGTEIQYGNTDKYFATGKWLINQIDFSNSCRIENTTSTTYVPPTMPTTEAIISSANIDKSSFVQLILLLAVSMIVMK